MNIRYLLPLAPPPPNPPQTANPPQRKRSRSCVLWSAPTFQSSPVTPDVAAPAARASEFSVCHQGVALWPSSSSNRGSAPSRSRNFAADAAPAAAASAPASAAASTGGGSSANSSATSSGLVKPHRLAPNPRRASQSGPSSSTSASSAPVSTEFERRQRDLYSEDGDAQCPSAHSRDRAAKLACSLCAHARQSRTRAAGRPTVLGDFAFIRAASSQRRRAALVGTGLQHFVVVLRHQDGHTPGAILVQVPPVRCQHVEPLEGGAPRRLHELVDGSPFRHREDEMRRHARRRDEALRPRHHRVA